MSTYRYNRPSKGYQIFKKVVIVTFGIAVLSLAIFGGRAYWVKSQVKKQNEAIAQVEAEKQSLEAELENLKIEKEKLVKEAQAKAETLWKYEPVIIPESMK